MWLVLHLYMVIVFYFFHFVPLKFGSANTHAWSKMFELVPISFMYQIFKFDPNLCEQNEPYMNDLGLWVRAS